MNQTPSRWVAATAAIVLAMAGMSACKRSDDPMRTPGPASGPSVGSPDTGASVPRSGTSGMSGPGDTTVGARSMVTAPLNSVDTVADTGSTKAGATTDTATHAGDSAPLAPADAKFIKQAAEGGLFEVAVGKLAADKASDPNVKAFGSMLAEQHGAANDKLKQIASTHGVALPTELPADKKRTLTDLGKLSGPAFDRKSVQTVGIKDHKADIAAFEKAHASAKAPDVRAFASETLPTLHSHLAEAQKLPMNQGGTTQR